MNVRPGRRARQQGRSAVTLLEIMLVLVILVLIGATAWPSIERSFADQRLRDAADMVRAEWQHARAEAMASGVAYQFCYEPKQRIYWIEPRDDVEEKTSADSGQSMPEGKEASRSELPENVTFANGKVAAGPVEGTSSETMPGMECAVTQSLETGEEDAPVVFFSDGTCNSAEITLQNEHERSITVTIHGLTAIPVVGEVCSAEEVRK